MNGVDIVVLTCAMTWLIISYDNDDICDGAYCLARFLLDVTVFILLLKTPRSEE